eukprot:4581511-Prymnesium_polylepis.1
MRRQRSAGRESSDTATDTQGRHTHMGSSYPTTTPPGRFGCPRRNSVGHASSPLYVQAGQVGSRHMLIPARRGTTNLYDEPAPRCIYTVSNGH